MDAFMLSMLSVNLENSYSMYNVWNGLINFDFNNIVN